MDKREFKIRNLSVLAYAQGFTFWHYKAEVLHDAVSPGWFNSASDMIAVGDVILVSSPEGSCLLSAVAVTPDELGNTVRVRETGLMFAIAQGS